MKALSLAFLLLLLSCGDTRTTSLEISASGLDDIKIGMKKMEVEKVLGTTLEQYNASTSGTSDPDSIVTTWGCGNCTIKYICKYEAVTFLLTFLKLTGHGQSDYELAGISSVPPSPLIHTKSGIKIGISEKEFAAICLKNGYPYNEEQIDDSSSSYLFTDELHEHSGKAVMAKFSNRKLVNLIVIHMIGE